MSLLENSAEHESNELLVTDLLDARDAVRLASNPSRFGLDLTLERAYTIGRRLHERLEARGFKPIGRKIGFTNRAMWEEFNVSEPFWAHMYDQTVHFADGGHTRLSLAGMVAPRLEPEIVVKLGHFGSTTEEFAYNAPRKRSTLLR
jgi:2-keto-4-pentenoate hydratase